MLYLKRFKLPSDSAEINAIKNESRTCFNTFYPFKIFPVKMLSSVDFAPITMLYGGNGSGKSTLINLIAAKLNAIRYSEFNSAPMFSRFVDICDAEYYRYPKASYVLTSDDVFDYVLNARSVNEKIDEKRNELFDKYVTTRAEALANPEIGMLKNLNDYDRWSETREILSKRRTQSSYVRARVAPDIDLYSNGETALRYFIDRIDEDALYLLDEPENSLSIELQIKLMEYIAATSVATKSQFIIATHSPIFLSMKDAKIYNLDSCPADTCRWTELANVRRYFDFFMEHRSEFD